MELRNFINDKKGSEMTIGTLVIIILAVIVLVVLAIGFTTGWENLWGIFMGLTGGRENVDDIVRACQTACATGAKRDYCDSERDLRYKENDEIVTNKVTCQDLEGGYKDLGDYGVYCPGISC